MPRVIAEQHSELVITVEDKATTFYPSNVGGLMKGVALVQDEATLAWLKARPEQFTILEDEPPVATDSAPEVEPVEEKPKTPAKRKSRKSKG